MPRPSWASAPGALLAAPSQEGANVPPMRRDSWDCGLYDLGNYRGGWSMGCARSQAGNASSRGGILCPSVSRCAEERLGACADAEAWRAAQNTPSGCAWKEDAACSSAPCSGHARARRVKRTSRLTVPNPRTSFLRLRGPSRTFHSPPWTWRDCGPAIRHWEMLRDERSGVNANVLRRSRRSGPRSAT
jgi:hypothetical protein